MPLTTDEVNKLFIYVVNRFNHMFTVRKYLSLALWSYRQVLFSDICIFRETIWLPSKEESIRGLQYFENYFAKCINEENTAYNLDTFLRLAKQSTT